MVEFGYQQLYQSERSPMTVGLLNFKDIVAEFRHFSCRREEVGRPSQCSEMTPYIFIQITMMTRHMEVGNSFINIFITDEIMTSIVHDDCGFNQVRRDSLEAGRGGLSKPSTRINHTVSQTTKPLSRNSKDGRISIGITDALAGRKFQSQHSFMKRDNVTTTFHSGMAALTSPTLEWKDVYRQAENLFLKGEYEQALVWYHRGRRLRPKAREFQAGIAKSERAIENRCAMPPSFAFNSLNSSPIQSTMESIITDSSGDSPINTTSRASTRMTMVSGGSSTFHTVRSLPTPHAAKMESSPLTMRKEKSFEADDVTGDQERKHLRKLKRDKMYLRDLLREMDNNVNNTEVQNIVEESLKYLDTRSKFWKQQIPLHAIRALQNRQFPFPVNSLSVRDESSLPSVNMTTQNGRRDNSANNMNHYILREVFKVHQDFLDGRYKECVTRADRCVQTIQIHKTTEIGKKFDIMASLYGVKGNAYFQLENYKEALRCYYKDLEIAKDREVPDAKSRALENIGRVYARVGEFDKAVQVWKEKTALCKSDVERTWLYHEIGYCYLSKREFSRAKQFGEMSYASAEHIGDLMWQLNSTVLIAQAEARMDDIQSAHDTFRYALDLAKLVGDRDEQQNINEVMGGLKKAIAEEKEEKRRKALENHKNKKKSPINILTEDDLWIDDWDGCDSPDVEVEANSKFNPQHTRGNDRRRRPRPAPTHKNRQKKDNESPEYGSRPESQVDGDGLSLQGGGVTLRQRHIIPGMKYRTEEYGGHRGDSRCASVDVAFDSHILVRPSTDSKPKKGILKNSNIPEMYTDLYPEHDVNQSNAHLLPAIAKSNLQIGNVKADLSTIVVNVPTMENEVEEDDDRNNRKTVRFKDENETFRLPDIPASETTTTELEDREDAHQSQPKRLMMRAVLESDGYFIGKYA